MVILGEENFIIDFKTGAGMFEQLLVYEWLLNQAEPREYKKRMFNVFSLVDGSDKKENVVDIGDIKAELKEVLDKCMETGYFCPENKTDRDKYRDVSRVDLI
jgi:hypothetical protein